MARIKGPYESDRFGWEAYRSPINSWPSIYRLQDHNKDITVNRTGNVPTGAMYNVGYARTGRDLGNYLGYNALGASDSVHPQILDNILDKAKELARTDPNFYMYNLQSRTQPQQQVKYTPPMTARPEQGSAPQALIAPYGQGTLQQQNTSADAFMQAMQTLMGGG